MRRMTKSEQQAYAVRHAPELARSGRFFGWWEIETHLRYEEACPEARWALDNERIRAELDRLCREAQTNAPMP
jgi:hypothetical protein